jgi:hypothetical protein
LDWYKSNLCSQELEVSAKAVHKPDEELGLTTHGVTVM